MHYQRINGFANILIVYIHYMLNLHKAIHIYICIIKTTTKLLLLALYINNRWQLNINDNLSISYITPMLHHDVFSDMTMFQSQSYYDWA